MDELRVQGSIDPVEAPDPFPSLTERMGVRYAELKAEEAAKSPAQRERETREARREIRRLGADWRAWIVAEAAKVGITLDPVTLDPPIRIRQTHTRRRGAGRPRAQASRSSARSGDSGSDSEPEPPRRRSHRPGAST